MLSPMGEQALHSCQRHGNALLKFLATNDVRRRESHQQGTLIPKQASSLFSPHEPIRGDNRDSFPTVLWWDGRETESRVVWYGKEKQEYRLTRFGQGFPHLTENDIGSLLVLVPESLERFEAFILDLDDDIDEIFSALGVEVTQSWGTIYDRDQPPQFEDEEECIGQGLRSFASSVSEFPSTTEMSKAAREIVLKCNPEFTRQAVDKQLLELHDREYELFKLVERVISGVQIVERVFSTEPSHKGSRVKQKWLNPLIKRRRPGSLRRPGLPLSVTC